jgi:N-acetylmuramoyl-L-alanine amidase
MLVVLPTFLAAYVYIQDRTEPEISAPTAVQATYDAAAEQFSDTEPYAPEELVVSESKDPVETYDTDSANSAAVAVYESALPLGVVAEKSADSDHAPTPVEDIDVEPGDISELFDLRVNTIVIDPGHGGVDPGAVGATGLKEKDITLDLANRLRHRLSRDKKYRVLLTRNSDKRLTLKERVSFANRVQADLFISLHINSMEKPQNAFIETYYYGMQAGQEQLHLVKRENHNSGYSTGDFKKMISRIGNTFKNEESRALAAAIQSNLYISMREENNKISTWGIKTAPFVVLLGVDMPSVLVEASCLCNTGEENRLRQETYRDRMARYLEQGIVEYLDKFEPKQPKGAVQYARQQLEQ